MTSEPCMQILLDTYYLFKWTESSGEFSRRECFFLSVHQGA